MQRTFKNYSGIKRAWLNGHFEFISELMLKIGHKGLSHGEVENTLGAFRAALRGGADGVELDVRMTKDGALVISHDPKIDRLTCGSGYVKDLGLQEIKSFKMRGSSERIATLEEAFDAIIEKEKPKAIQVDLKVSGVAKQLLDQIYSRDIQDIVIISSFHKSIIGEIRSLDKNIQTGLIKVLPTNGPIEYLASETEENKLKLKAKEVAYHLYLYAMLAVNRLSGSIMSDLISDARQVDADYAMFYWKAATKSFVKRAHRNDLKVIAGVVNSGAGIRRLERLGVDGITTDLMELLRTDKFAEKS